MKYFYKIREQYKQRENVHNLKKGHTSNLLCFVVLSDFHGMMVDLLFIYLFK